MRARHTIDITEDSEQHDKEGENRRTETRIDMTADDITETRSPTQIVSATNALKIIEFNNRRKLGTPRWEDRQNIKRAMSGRTIVSPI